MPAWQFWRVTVAGARKAHLMPYIPGQDSGTMALCRKPLEGRGKFETIVTPKGDECQECRRISGHFKQKLTDEQRKEIDQYKAWDRVLKIFSDLGMSDEQKRTVVEDLLKKIQSR